MSRTKLMLGDNISSLKKLPDNSIDSVVTDPPYGLSFMNKKWDYDVPSVEFWKEVYRVLKPGGHILSFGGTRTYHRMVVNIEDAGFEIRDQIMWIYGSGFPKSLNIGKAVDKMEGNEREVVGELKQPRMSGDYGNGRHNERKIKQLDLTKGTSHYEGWGTALKPANEPICVARKPLSEKSVAENVMKWGTGGINVDGCRIETDDNLGRDCKSNPYGTDMFIGGKNVKPIITGSIEGRFPANLIFECICDEVIKGEQGEVKETQPRNKRFDPTQHNSKSVYEAENGFTTKDYNDSGDIHTNPDCPCRILDEQSGVSKSVGGKKDLTKSNNTNPSKITNNIKSGDHFSDKGGASRFFYNAKVSKSERNMGLDGRTNGHPTLKPINLMTYLCRLVTTENGIVLDPFMGSGSTGISAQLEGFRFCGMEMDEDYFKIAEARINSYESYRKFVK